MQNNIYESYEFNTEEDTLKDKYLTFFSDNQLFGIPIAHVVQIVGVQEIIAVPEFPAYAKGIINMRGNIIPIIDVRMRLNKPEADYCERTCIIVTNVNDSFIGFIVDDVNEVTNIEENDILQPPALNKDYVNRYITGIAKKTNKLILLMDIQKMLSNEEIEEIDMITNLNIEEVDMTTNLNMEEIDMTTNLNIEEWIKYLI